MNHAIHKIAGSTLIAALTLTGTFASFALSGALLVSGLGGFTTTLLRHSFLGLRVVAAFFGLAFLGLRRVALMGVGCLCAALAGATLVGLHLR